MLRQSARELEEDPLWGRRAGSGVPPSSGLDLATQLLHVQWHAGFLEDPLGRVVQRHAVQGSETAFVLRLRVQQSPGSLLDPKELPEERGGLLNFFRILRRPNRPMDALL
jgi:hypothetical protein